jgi:hypothetical protein
MGGGGDCVPLEGLEFGDGLEISKPFLVNIHRLILGRQSGQTVFTICVCVGRSGRRVKISIGFCTIQGIIMT